MSEADLPVVAENRIEQVRRVPAPYSKKAPRRTSYLFNPSAVVVDDEPWTVGLV